MQNILITGGEHDDRVTCATQIALRLLCESSSLGEACMLCANCTRVHNHTHPNFIFIEPKTDKDDGTKKSHGVIKIDQIREVVLASNKTNFERGKNVFVISHMHQTTKSAANALLKVMEESKHDKIFIALAPSRTSVLATIASRLVSHQVKPNMERYLVKNSDVQQKIIAISKAPLAGRYLYCERMSADRDTLIGELQDLIHECHVMLRTKDSSPLFILKLSDALMNAVTHLKLNLNPRLVAERLVLREWPSLAN